MSKKNVLSLVSDSTESFRFLGLKRVSHAHGQWKSSKNNGKLCNAVSSSCKLLHSSFAFLVRQLRCCEKALDHLHLIAVHKRQVGPPSTVFGDTDPSSLDHCVNSGPSFHDLLVLFQHGCVSSEVRERRHFLRRWVCPHPLGCPLAAYYASGRNKAWFKQCGCGGCTNRFGSTCWIDLAQNAFLGLSLVGSLGKQPTAKNHTHSNAVRLPQKHVKPPYMHNKTRKKNIKQSP